MKRRVLGLFSVLCALVLAVALAGCGGGDIDTSAFIGHWKLTGVEGMEGVTTSDLATLEDYGLVCTLDINEDGSCKLDLFEEVSDGTWKASSSTKVEFSFDGDTETGTLDSGKLTMEEDGEKLIFEQTDE